MTDYDQRKDLYTVSLAAGAWGVSATNFVTYVDFMALLKKYIAHVRACEGVDYIDRIGDVFSSDVAFTPDETDALRKCAGCDE